jgi:drug/metabolite transporter (DMT)-like permease
MQTARLSAETRGSLAAVGALAAVGSLVASADVISGYPVATGQALRYALAAAVLIAVAHGRLPRLHLREALGLAALAATGLALFNLFVIAAVREGDPATVGVIVGCVPVVLALAGPFLEGRPLSAPVVAAAAVVAVGAAAVQQVGGGLTALGLVLAVGALACEAAFSLFAVPLLGRLGALAVSAYACLFAVPMLAIWSLVAEGPALPAPRGEELAALVYMGVVVTTGGFVLWYRAVELLDVERAGLFSGVLPVSALLCSAAIGAGEITPAQLLAVAVVAAGVTAGMRVARSGTPRAAEEARPRLRLPAAAHSSID